MKNDNSLMAVCGNHGMWRVFLHPTVVYLHLRMPEAPEIPEASDAFGKQVAITIAILAVVLAVVDNKSDNAKTDAIIKTNEASNKWGYYQAKSLKQNLCETEGRLLTLLQPGADAATRSQAIARTATEAKRYGSEKDEIKIEAEKLAVEAERNSKINDRCDHAALGLQIGIVICSVAILSKWRPLWYIGIGLGIVGAAVGVTAFLM